MKTNTYCIVLIACVTCMLQCAESCRQCGVFGNCCEDDETCTNYDECVSTSRQTDCGGFYCTKPTTCCGFMHCCPEGTTCCGLLVCCEANTYCDGYTCKAHSNYGTAGSFGWYYLLFIFVPAIAICAGVCRWIRYTSRGTGQNAAAHQTTPRRARNNGYSGDRIFVAYSINSSSVATISDRTPDPHTNAAFAGPPSYEELSHASPIGGASVYANDAAKMAEPPSYNDVISGKAAGLNMSGGQSGNGGGESSDSGATSDSVNSSSESGGVDNMAYV